MLDVTHGSLAENIVARETERIATASFLTLPEAFDHVNGRRVKVFRSESLGAWCPRHGVLADGLA